MPTTRRMLKLTTDEAKIMREHAAVLGVSVSAVGRAWIEEFAEHGSDLPKDSGDHDRVQILVDSDTLAEATEKARLEYGVGLSQILRHKIASLRQ